MTDDDGASKSGPPDTRAAALMEALGVTAVVTALATAASLFVPPKHGASAVGLTFLAAVWLMVWRRDDARVERFGVAFGGLVLPGKLELRAVFGALLRAVGWALLFACVTFVPFFVGWRWWWDAGAEFHFVMPADEWLNEIAGQLLIIALPEEAFYRGYVQTRLDEAFPRKIQVFGAAVGPSLLVTSALFAVGHFATIHNPARLAVFFPSLLFGWLRARTGGVGASVLFHAACNVFSATLGRGYGIY